MGRILMAVLELQNQPRGLGPARVGRSFGHG